MNSSQKLSKILDSYFSDNSYQASIPNFLNENLGTTYRNNRLPVKPASCDWEIFESPERFSRTFKFGDKQAVIDFLSEVLTYEMSSNHSGSHRIEDLEVTVEVYTHDINRITELDQSYIENINYIYRDISDFR